MKNTAKIIYSIALVLVTFSLQVQETFPDDVNDVPIDDWVIPMVFLGIVVGYVYFRKRKAIQ